MLRIFRWTTVYRMFLELDKIFAKLSGHNGSKRLQVETIIHVCVYIFLKEGGVIFKNVILTKKRRGMIDQGPIRFLFSW